MAESAQDQRSRLAARALRARMVRRLVAGGALTDPAWRRAFAEVPRHLFVPGPEWYAEHERYASLGRYGEHERYGEQERFRSPGPAERPAEAADPRGNGRTALAADARRRLRMLAGAYTDRAIAVRVADGRPVSSLSQPSLMARMCEALDVRDGQRVLEIGAGTGYNAALFAHRLGPDAVTTVDLDPELTALARANLAAYGTPAARSVVVVAGDGALGHPDRAPYDRIVATCELPYIPPAWPRQCRPGGLILAPFGGGLVLLTVRGPASAEGRFLPAPAYFVPLRGPSAARAGQAPQEPGEGPREPPPSGILAGRHPDRARYGLTVEGPRQWVWRDDPHGGPTWRITA